MEQLGEIMRQQNTKSLKLSQPYLERKDDNSISLYTGELTENNIAKNAKKIMGAFNLRQEFYEVLAERIKENKFSDERLTDAVNYVIDNCKYPTPTISDFISYDKRIKVYSYNDILKLFNELGKSVWTDYIVVQIDGISDNVYINKIEAEIKGLKYKEIYYENGKRSVRVR